MSFTTCGLTLGENLMRSLLPGKLSLMEIVYNIYMSNAKVSTSNKKQNTNLPKLPSVGSSRFSGNKGNFGFANSQKFSAKAQFSPPAIRVTQNKGGGGK